MTAVVTGSGDSGARRFRNPWWAGRSAAPRPGSRSPDGVDPLAGLVEGRPGVVLSPYAGQQRPIGLQSWCRQLFVDAADDPCVGQFVDLVVFHRAHNRARRPCGSPSSLADPWLASAG